MTQGVGRVSFHCPLGLFPALMSHPPWGRELLRVLPNTLNYDILKKIKPAAETRRHQVSDRRQPAGAPVPCRWSVLYSPAHFFSAV